MLLLLVEAPVGLRLPILGSLNLKHPQQLKFEWSGAIQLGQVEQVSADCSCHSFMQLVPGLQGRLKGSIVHPYSVFHYDWHLMHVLSMYKHHKY